MSKRIEYLDSMIVNFHAIASFGNSKINCGKCGHPNEVKSFDNKENTKCDKCGNILIKVN